MNSNTFRVTFHGEIIQGWELDEVKANMAGLFSLNPNNPQHIRKIERLFSGRTVVIKEGINEITAQAYVNAITKAGGEARIKAKSLPPAGIDERRIILRRKQRNRRSIRRTSTIRPDRRHNRDRRDIDPND